MAGASVNELSEPAMHEFLLALLDFKSPELRLALDRQPALTVPTAVVRAESAVFNVPPMSAETIAALFRSVSSLPQRRQLKRDGRVRFVYVFEAMRAGRQVVGGFRIEAKAVNGRLVLLTCHNLRRYALQENNQPQQV
jgi:hypothetical protein